MIKRLNYFIIFLFIFYLFRLWIYLWIYLSVYLLSCDVWILFKLWEFTWRVADLLSWRSSVIFFCIWNFLTEWNIIHTLYDLLALIDRKIIFFRNSNRLYSIFFTWNLNGFIWYNCKLNKFLIFFLFWLILYIFQRLN